VVFLIDISGSMRGDPLENAKIALVVSLSKLNPEDTFNIIAFNGEVLLFSPSMKLATKEAISDATEWVGANFIANGSTNILLPLNQVSLIFNMFQVTDQMYSNYYACEVQTFFFNLDFIYFLAS
jgi:uncharacterized protein with von Willebrand factor type A (vWA) domain